jgi:hypothetical protein
MFFINISIILLLSSSSLFILLSFSFENPQNVLIFLSTNSLNISKVSISTTFSSQLLFLVLEIITFSVPHKIQVLSKLLINFSSKKFIKFSFKSFNCLIINSCSQSSFSISSIFDKFSLNSFKYKLSLPSNLLKNSSKDFFLFISSFLK